MRKAVKSINNSILKEIEQKVETITDSRKKAGLGNRPRAVSPDVKNLVFRAIDEGLKAKDIARAANVSAWSICNWKKQRGMNETNNTDIRRLELVECKKDSTSVPKNTIKIFIGSKVRIELQQMSLNLELLSNLGAIE